MLICIIKQTNCAYITLYTIYITKNAIKTRAHSTKSNKRKISWEKIDLKILGESAGPNPKLLECSVYSVQSIHCQRVMEIISKVWLLGCLNICLKVTKIYQLEKLIMVFGVRENIQQLYESLVSIGKKNGLKSAACGVSKLLS